VAHPGHELDARVRTSPGSPRAHAPAAHASGGRIPFGWLIPVAVLFVISFPPLFGHEIVAVLCGLVWGLGPGFAIVAAGTFIGEIGNF
jgi:uncharacterized membrane protein YdjX (TVP38/TMEM64 family)